MPSIANTLGARRFALPSLAALLLACILSLVFYPMSHMDARGLPFAVLNLDEGASTPAGEVNAGAQAVTALTSADIPAIDWVVVDSQAALDAAVEENDYYGAVIIPSDFTSAQAAAASGDGSGPTVQVLLDNAKSPLVASQMSTTFSTMLGQFGVTADIQTLHTGTSSATGNPLMSQQLSIMPTIMLSLIASLLIAFVVSPVRGLTGAARRRGILVQLTTILVTSAIIGVMLWAMVTTVGGLDMSAAGMLFFWLASAAVMVLLVGAFDLWAPLGVLIALGIFALGMACGPLPPEMLPSFWQDWVYPWAPQHFIGSGVRDIAYMGAGAWPAGSVQLALTGCAGLVLLGVSALLPGRAHRQADAAEGVQ